MNSLYHTEHLANVSALIKVSRQVSPLLDEIAKPTCIIEADRDSCEQIATLYRFWQTHFPEAGRIYWQTRTWTMLIWQPVTLALITTYYTDSVPKLSSMQQALNTETGTVGNFAFPVENWQRGDQHQRLLLAAKELTSLLDKLSVQASKVFRLSLATTEKLLADTLMEMLLRGLKYMVASNLLAEDRLQAVYTHELEHWQQALSLFKKRFGWLDIDNQGEHFVQRQSCCMHYKRKDGEFCQGCPQDK
ncbi:hypothetical protein JCM19239_4528 [Vibrio variabilis]|uniref:Ferric siderophore reductase C-terminal domain-containing protein n=1 Tax=Vibrio variabilis TaxID=990271 RepID=A0ABQ0J7Q9_9VIBR|nr:hypothetical protein JCM19239_4528 [Vibrio variabilis]